MDRVPLVLVSIGIVVVLGLVAMILGHIGRLSRNACFGLLGVSEALSLVFVRAFGPTGDSATTKATLTLALVLPLVGYVVVGAALWAVSRKWDDRSSGW